ncbi:MAG: TonB-dependent receptor [Gammaproteobacteria bacterium]|nr:TonB-dependent receptor [Gammaproteobacteria bacterium]
MIKHIRNTLLVIAAVLFSASAFSQVTSSDIRGELIDAQGNPVAGQMVEVIHTPTGRVKTAETTDNGVFYLTGLNVGGPYVVKLADSSSMQATPIEELYLQLGKTSNVTLQVSSGDQVVTVVGNRLLAGSYQNGAGREFDERDINNSAAISRDLKSVLKRDAKVVVDSTVNDGPALSIAGGNIRSNSLTVDGVKQNDDFGLNKNGYPGRRTPISLDAIEQIQVNISPFDVTYGDFQGGNVNIVTKSGTNDVEGSVFYFHSDESLIGDKSEGVDLNVGDFKEDTFGFTLGGPIANDKLFFFASYEKFESTSPYQFSLDNQNGTVEPNEKIGITQGDYDLIASIAQSVWGFDIGNYNFPKEESDEKLLLKFDWYINDDHRASLTYQDNEGNTVRDFWGETFPNAPWTTSQSNRYNQAESLKAYSLQFFSDWSSNFSTQIQISDKSVKTDQDPLMRNDFPQIQVLTDNGGILYIGPDQFRHANELSNDRFTLKFKGDLHINDDHKLTFGLDMEELDIYNLFVFGSNGFSGGPVSVADFQAQNVFLVYQNSLTGNPLDAVDAFKYDITTFYIQDEWYVNDQLSMTYGLRHSKYTNNDKPFLNDNFVTRQGYTNQGNFDGLTLLEPRFGFTYNKDQDTVIRGGIGLFGGGGPNVWLSNSYGNDGKRKVFTGCLAIENICLDDAGGFSFDINQSLAAGGFGGANVNGDTNSISPDFEIPSVWKYNLAIDTRMDLGFMGEDWVVSSEIIVEDVKNAAVYRELNFQQQGTAPDGRPIYQEVAPYDLSLENTSKGGGIVWSSSASKRFVTDGGSTIDLDIGYTYQDKTEVNPGNAFIAFEGYAMPASYDFQAQNEYNSEFEIRHTFVANLTWQKALIGDNMTTVSLTHTGRSGRHYSPTMRTNADFGGFLFSGFGDWDAFSSQSLYVPSDVNDPTVTYAPGFDTNGFFDYINSSACLSKFKGKIVDRHACTSSWINRFDLRVMQEVKFDNGNALELIFDIENLGNLINDDWGRVQGYVQPFNAPIVDASIVNGQYVYDNFTIPQQTVAKVPSLWKIQLGARYRF